MTISHNEAVSTSATGAEVTFQVSDSNDDALEDTIAGAADATNINYVAARALNIATGRYFYGGVRFQDVTISNGATINSAYLQIYIFTSTYDSPRLTIYGEDIDDSQNFSTNNTITGRTTTSASVVWNESNLSINEYHNSPDISSVIQEIIDRTGWTSGNNLSLLLYPLTDLATNGVYFYDYRYLSGIYSAKLVIDYS